MWEAISDDYASISEFVLMPNLSALVYCRITVLRESPLINLDGRPRDCTRGTMHASNLLQEGAHIALNVEAPVER